MLSSNFSIRSIRRLIRWATAGKPTRQSNTKESVATVDHGLSIETMNPCVKNFDYAIRGSLMARALQIKTDISSGKQYPFPDVVMANMGNPLAFGQKPLTFVRQVLSIMMYPELANDQSLPKDVRDRAKRYLSMVPSVGAYSESQGIAGIRDDVAQYIKERDGFPSDSKTIFLTNGATEALKHLFQCLLRDSSAGYKDGVFLPTPNYPMYSAFAGFHNAIVLKYYLDERNNWSLNINEIKSSISQAKASGITIRGLVVINPGNPTGQILDEGNMKQVVEICAQNQILLIADEVYQLNVWNRNKKFVSFKKVACEMGFKQDDANSLQLISFNSASKGFFGECGLRGGYCELFGIQDDVRQQMYKLASISLCSSVMGQIGVGLLVNPPKQGDESFELFKSERDQVLSSLSRRAYSVTKMMNSLSGVSCNSTDGALYAFPSIQLPPKAVARAKEMKMAADELYALELLEATGVAIVHGSGFGQRDGSYHFRVTILPPEDVMTRALSRWKVFHDKFMAAYLK